MNVLSLFDGMSCGQVALERAGIPIERYLASEIDKYAIQVTQHNYPATEQLGDVCGVSAAALPDIDLMMGGSPCQSLSIANRQTESGLVQGKSILFWEFHRLLQEVSPKYFLLENVASMKNADKDTISSALGVEPITINSSLVSAQQRKRHYWTNIPNITQPEDKGIYLKDILETGYTEKLKSYCITATYARACPQDCFNHSQRQMIFNKPVRVAKINKGGQGERIYSIDGKSISLSANSGGLGRTSGLYEIGEYVRRLTPVECERLQTVPDNYTDVDVTNAQRYKMLGNGWTVDVIVHIFGEIAEARLVA